MNKLGIIQGRLLKPIDGHIQEFPINNWEVEFNLIKKIGIDHIEWIITPKSFNSNILKIDIEKYSKNISSICCDNLITENIFYEVFLLQQLNPICLWALRNKIGVITIPLLEESVLTNENKNRLINLFSFYNIEYPQLEFHFEIEANIDLALEFIKPFNNFFLVYDTGNITSSGYDHIGWITKGINHIKNVHLKDRTKSPIKTVEPFNGDTDFKLIFKMLKQNYYNGKYTIQTARGQDGDELSTIIKHIKQFKELYNEELI